MNNLEVLKSELHDNIELLDWVINNISNIKSQIEQLENEGVAL